MFWISSMPLAVVAPWLTAWLTPMWILGLGVLGGLAILGLAWAVLWLISRPAAEAAVAHIRDGLMIYVFWIAVGLAAFSVLGPLVVTNPGEMIRSMRRLNSATAIDQEFPIKATTDEQTIDIAFRGDELRHLTVSSTEPLVISSRSMTQRPDATANPAEELPGVIEVSGVRDYEWYRGAEAVSPLGNTPITRLYITNPTGFATTLRVQIETAPRYPQMAVIPVTAISVVAVFLAYIGLHAMFPKLGAVALATSKSESAQPLYIILMSIGVLAIVLFMFVPYHTFGEDIKMLKDTGFTLILVFNLIFAIWAASSSVAEEIEGRTALTVLSKPIGRAQFILGKFFGIMWAVLLMFVVLGVTLLIVVAYKPIYDARETSNLPPEWQSCFLEVARTVPGLVLAFMEVSVMTALSVAISTRLPLLANFVVCFVVYVLGHLTPSIVQSSLNGFEPVAFVARLIATVLPILDVFNIQAAVAADKVVPWHYLGGAAIYCLLYTVLAMLLALTLFEDRDLA
ncbi:MAG: ABC transporter permease subunit [Pirellulales bacterium]